MNEAQLAAAQAARRSVKALAAAQVMLESLSEDDGVLQHLRQISISEDPTMLRDLAAVERVCRAIVAAHSGQMAASAPVVGHG